MDSTDHHIHLRVGRGSAGISKQPGADAVAGVHGGESGLRTATLPPALLLSPHPGSHAPGPEGQKGQSQ